MSRVDIGRHHEDIPAEEAAWTRRFVRPGTLKIRANGATSARKVWFAFECQKEDTSGTI
jgi:hypothetical protein